MMLVKFGKINLTEDLCIHSVSSIQIDNYLFCFILMEFKVLSYLFGGNIAKKKNAIVEQMQS